MKLYLIRENYKIAVNSIKSNLLRTILTVMIIAVGIMSLVGILTAIDALKGSLSEQFASMGSNTFTIDNWKLRSIKGGPKHKRNTKTFESIKYRDAQNFKKDYKFPSKVSVNVKTTGSATIKYKSYKSNPNISVVGSEENYIFTSGLNIEKGRAFSEQEVLSSKNVVVIGSDLAKTAFKNEIKIFFLSLFPNTFLKAISFFISTNFIIKPFYFNFFISSAVKPVLLIIVSISTFAKSKFLAVPSKKRWVNLQSNILKPRIN